MLQAACMVCRLDTSRGGAAGGLYVAAVAPARRLQALGTVDWRKWMFCGGWHVMVHAVMAVWWPSAHKQACASLSMQTAGHRPAVLWCASMQYPGGRGHSLACSCQHCSLAICSSGGRCGIHHTSSCTQQPPLLTGWCTDVLGMVLGHQQQCAQVLVCARASRGGTAAV
jgi:hypothetical protein